MSTTKTRKAPTTPAAPPEDLTSYMRAEVGARIKKLRKRAKLTASQLAIATQVGQGQVFRWEAGDNELTFAGLARTADALGCQIGDLFPVTSTVMRVRRQLGDKD